MMERIRLSALVLATVVLAAQTFGADPGKPTAEELVNRLTPAPLTRGFAPSTRGIAVEGAAAPATASVDLDVNFEFNSATLTTDAMLTIDQLGQALKNPALVKSRFRIAGHTDAVGGDAFNQGLSEKRAAAVRNYLIDRYGIEAHRLESIGYGRTRLRDKANPEADVNRRVEVTNLGG